jgi:hypothetical protein
MDLIRQNKIKELAPFVFLQCERDILKCCGSGKSSVERDSAEILSEAAVIVALGEGEEGASDEQILALAIKIYLQWIRQEYDADRIANLKIGNKYRKVPVLDYRALPWGAPIKRSNLIAIAPEADADRWLFYEENQELHKKALLKIFEIITAKYGIHAAIWYMLYKSQGKSLRRLATDLGITKYRLGRKEYNRVMKNIERSIHHTQALLSTEKDALRFVASYED